jgi:hypothetical protein
MRFVVDEVALKQVFSHSTLVFPLLISCHQFAILIIYVLLLAGGQVGKPGNLQTKHCSFVYPERIERRVCGDIHITALLLPPFSSPLPSTAICGNVLSLPLCLSISSHCTSKTTLFRVSEGEGVREHYYDGKRRTEWRKKLYCNVVVPTSNFEEKIRQFLLMWDVNCFHSRYMLKDQHLQLAT